MLWKIVASYGFSQSQADHTMFYKHTRNDKVMVLIVYVDIILTNNDETRLTFVNTKVSWWFSNQRPKNLKVLRHGVC